MTVNHSFQVRAHTQIIFQDENSFANPRCQTLWAVPLSCDGCVKSVSDALFQLHGVTKVEGDVEKQLVSVEGSGTLQSPFSF